MDGFKKIKGIKKLLNNLKKVAFDMKNQKDINSNAVDDETSSDLHYGDIIYLRFETEINYENGDSKPFQGYMCGDGLALNYVSIRSLSTLNRTTLSRFLYRIEPPARAKQKRKIVKKNPEMLNNLKLDENDKNDKENEDQDEDLNFEKKYLKIGDPVLYGSELRMKHMYSKAYLQINPFSLSKEEECVEVTLTHDINKYCSMKWFDPSQTKRPGELINSNDTIGISFVHANNFFFRVHEQLHQKESMFVNAGKEAGMFKIKFFSGYDESNLSHNGNVMNGNIIKLLNKDTDHYLGVNYDPVNYSIEERKRVSINGDCDKYLNSGFQTKYKHRTKLEQNKENEAEDEEDDDENKEDISKVNAQQKNDNDVACLWEIRIKNNLKEVGISNSNKRGDEIFLKNILTGQFLYYDHDTQDLTLQDLNEKGLNPKGFEFFLKMKNNWSSGNCLKYNSLITLKNSINKTHVNFYERDHEDYEVKVSNSQKNSYRFFVIENAGREKHIAFKIKNINSYINKFYLVRIISFCKISEFPSKISKKNKQSSISKNVSKMKRNSISKSIRLSFVLRI
jgi:hypothetical protein